MEFRRPTNKKTSQYKMKYDFNEILKIVTPAIVGYTCVLLCPVGKTSGETQIQRPPAVVFGIIWPILYILIGFSWHKSNENAIFCALTIFLGLWIITYGCVKNKKISLYILAVIVALTATAISLCSVSDKIAAYAMTPVLAWTLIAFLLNWHDV